MDELNRKALVGTPPGEPEWLFGEGMVANDRSGDGPWTSEPQATGDYDEHRR